MVTDFSLSTDAAESVGFTIGRGHIGATTVNLYVVKDSEEILINTFQWSGINPDDQNRTTFTVAPSSLLNASKKPVGMNVSIRAAFCSNEIGGLSFNMPEPLTDVNDFQVTSDGNALDCVIVDGRLACTGMAPDVTTSGKICGAREKISVGCVEFTVQVPACTVRSAGGDGGGGSNACPAGQTDYCDPPHPGEIPFCGCH